MSIWSEIRNIFFVEEEGFVSIDAWLTTNSDEEGKVIARVHLNGEVSYLDPRAKEDPIAQEVICETLGMVEDGIYA